MGVDCCCRCLYALACVLFWCSWWGFFYGLFSCAVLRAFVLVCLLVMFSIGAFSCGLGCCDCFGRVFLCFFMGRR